MNNYKILETLILTEPEFPFRSLSIQGNNLPLTLLPADDATVLHFSEVIKDHLGLKRISLQYVRKILATFNYMFEHTQSGKNMFEKWKEGQTVYMASYN